MSRLAKIPRSKPRRLLVGSTAPPWLWVLALISVGSFVILVGYMEAYQKNNPPLSTPANKGTGQAGKHDAKAVHDNKPISTTFDFYKLLPELESIIPDRNPEQKSGHKSNASDAVQSPEVDNSNSVDENKNTATGRYFLQAGSFKDFQAADSRRASLALIGVESDIQNATIPNRGLWHRVRIGPFATLAEMRDTRKRLKNNNIDSIMLTVKN